MSGLKNTTKRLWNFSTGKGYKTDGENRAENKAKKQAKLDKVYVDANTIPDDELIKRNERRKAAKRQGSRAATVLTNQDQLG